MAGQSSTETRGPILGLSVGKGLREGALFVFGMGALALALALLTYHPSDPGFSDTGTGASVHNLIGPFGAWISSAFFFGFGKPAFLFPVMLLLAGWMIFKSRRFGEGLSRQDLGFRLIGFFLTLATSCGLATLHFTSGALPSSSGGVLGRLVGEGMAGSVGQLGATLLLLGVWLAGVSLFAGVSWLAIMDALGAFVLDTGDRIKSLWAGFADRRAGRKVKLARAELVKEQTTQARERVAPKIEPPVNRPVISDRVERERQTSLFEGATANAAPPLALLDDPPDTVVTYTPESLEARSKQVEIKLREFNIEAQVVSVHPGPVVTRFELLPAPGLKASRVTALSRDLARSLSATAVRVVEVIPGKSVIGLEIPNETRELVTLGEVLQSRAYDKMKSPLSLGLGKDIQGKAVVIDLAKMPHLLIAGTTGSGKSVALNAMVLSLLYKATADQVRLIMIDPKMLELSVYEGIPHLLSPVVTDMKESANALRWCVAEMERRYQLMSALSVRNLAGYNRKINDGVASGEPVRDPLYKIEHDADGQPLEEAPELTALPQIVVVVDELADMMMMVGKKVEELIARLAQKARASGIHLILATQRPSVDVITGLIKANIPARIAFQVSSRIDSRTILDQMGAEHLLGHGDMLYLPGGTSIPQRIHGAFVDDHEVLNVVSYLKSLGEPNYIDEILSGPSGPIPGLQSEAGEAGEDVEQDPLYDQAVRLVTETRKASISGVQRRLKIGYNRAARMVEAMEEAGLVGPLQSNGAREVIAPPPPAD
ncbi:MAG: cell division protein FtsK [Gammaproteobacteria bacterium]|nr:cell division protein FtsK [Gammaproteobacteria bacterium]